MNEAVSPDLPMIDLHLHLDGAVRTRTLLELADERGVDLPAQDVDSLQRHVTVPDTCRSLTEFLSCFEVFYPVLKSPRALERVARELCEDLHEQGHVYAEVRFAPVLLAGGGVSQEELVRGTLRGLESGREAQDLPVNLILCLYRGTDPERNRRTVELAARYRERGVVGIDLAGDESRHDARSHAGVFRRARALELPITVHAGEAGPAGNVREALELGARRIGHGVRLAEDPDLLEEVRERRVPLEMCYTSNLQTGAVKDPGDHPLGRFLRGGLNVTVNTDDPRVSRTSLPREFERVRRRFSLTRSDQVDLLRNAVRASFASSDLKTRLLDEVEEAASPR